MGADVYIVVHRTCLLSLTNCEFTTFAGVDLNSLKVRLMPLSHCARGACVALESEVEHVESH